MAVTEHSIHEHAFVHPTAVIDAPVAIGDGARVWHFCHVMAGAEIGAGSTLGHACFVGAGVRVGCRVKVQNHVSLFEGIELDDDVFVGPGVAFTNVRHPRATVSRHGDYALTRVSRGATIGANATIVCGVTLGEHCFVAAGAVVTRDVGPFVLVAGVPARPVGWISRLGERLGFDAAGRARCPVTGEEYALGADGVRLR
jgi:UDP-2-acetamido-3-amino-2,3-dideoxy-glucuronate N-acetyltransferase